MTATNLSIESARAYLADRRVYAHTALDHEERISLVADLTVRADVISGALWQPKAKQEASEVVAEYRALAQEVGTAAREDWNTTTAKRVV